MSMKNFFLATRPWSFTASLVPSIIGLILADKNVHFRKVDLLLSFFSIFTVISAQAAGNLVNTYYDFINGIDKKILTEDKQRQSEIGSSRSGGDSTLTDNIVTIEQLFKLLLTCYLASLISFAFILTATSARSEILILLYALGLAGSYFYTGGGVPLKYNALGDLVILFTFGPLISEFTFASRGGHLSMTPIYISLPLAIIAETILYVNNMRDIKTDKEAGILTLVMILGTGLSRVTVAILLVIPYLFCVFTVYYTQCWLFLLPCFTAGMAADIYRRVRATRFASLPEHVAKLHLIFGIFYAIALYFCGIRALF